MESQSADPIRPMSHRGANEWQRTPSAPPPLGLQTSEWGREEGVQKVHHDVKEVCGTIRVHLCICSARLHEEHRRARAIKRLYAPEELEENLPGVRKDRRGGTNHGGRQ
jgi:hypothetical protein